MKKKCIRHKVTRFVKRVKLIRDIITGEMILPAGWTYTTKSAHKRFLRGG